MVKGKNKPWFENQEWENRIDGLEKLGDVTGKTILDLGCAEGRISEYLVQLGANCALGFDYSLIRVSAETVKQVHLQFGDLNYPELLPEVPEHDIVLVMAVLKQLKNPYKLLMYAASKCKWRMVVRVPAGDTGLYTGPAGVIRTLGQEKFKLVGKKAVTNSVGQKSFVGIFQNNGNK